MANRYYHDYGTQNPTYHPVYHPQNQNFTSDYNRGAGVVNKEYLRQPLHAPYPTAPPLVNTPNTELETRVLIVHNSNNEPSCCAYLCECFCTFMEKVCCCLVVIIICTVTIALIVYFAKFHKHDSYQFPV